MSRFDLFDSDALGNPITGLKAASIKFIAENGGGAGVRPTGRV